MKKTILTYGLLSSAVTVVMLSLTTVYSHQIGFDRGYIIGYATIILSLSFIFFGIKSYRDRIGNGSVTFGKAFLIGILIAIISSLFYVITWLIIYYNFMPDFMQLYANYEIEKMKAAGATQEVINQKMEQMQQMTEMLKNPFINAAYTFMEPFPVGVIIALISALVLKRKSAAKTEAI